MGRTLTFEGANQTHSYTVRDRISVIYLTIDAPSGGQGGFADFEGGSGGSGGRLVVALDVSSGEVVDLYTGAQGEDGQDETAGEVASGGAGGPSPLTNGQDGGSAQDAGDGGGGAGGGGESGADAPNGDTARAGGGGGGSGDAGDSVGGAGGDGGGPGGAGGAETTSGSNDGSPGSTSASGAWTIQSQADGGSTHASAGWIELVEGGPDSCSVTIADETRDDITLSLASSSDADGYYIYRSDTQGFDPTPSNRIADVTRSGSTQTYTDGPFDEGERKYYAVEAYSTEGVTEARTTGITDLPAPRIKRVDLQNGDELALDWVLDSVDETAVRVFLSRDDGTTWTQVGSDLAAGTTSFTTLEQLDGERFRVAVVAVGKDTTTSDTTNGAIA